MSRVVLLDKGGDGEGGGSTQQLAQSEHAAECGRHRRRVSHHRSEDEPERHARDLHGRHRAQVRRRQGVHRAEAGQEVHHAEGRHFCSRRIRLIKNKHRKVYSKKKILDISLLFFFVDIKTKQIVIRKYKSPMVSYFVNVMCYFLKILNVHKCLLFCVFLNNKCCVCPMFILCALPAFNSAGFIGHFRIPSSHKRDPDQGEVDCQEMMMQHSSKKITRRDYFI